MAVQRHAGLQAQRVAAGQAARDQALVGAGRGQRRPQVLGVGGGAEDLEAVLAGVAGAGQPDLTVRHGGGQQRVVLEGGQVGVGELGQDAVGLGALDGEQRVGVAVVADDGVEAGRALGQGVQHHLGVGGVGDHQVLVLRGAVDDQVVQDAAVLAADHGVAGAQHAERGDEADQRVVEQLAGLRTGDGDLAHVREVEQTGLGADGEVLLALAAVAQRHVPAREVGHGGAERAVQRVERGQAEGHDRTPGIWKRAGWGESPRLSSNLRASPHPGQDGGLHRGWAHGVAVSSFQICLARAVRGPERFRGGLAPSAPVATG